MILLYAGMVDDATELIRAILQQPDDEQYNMLRLAGQCLAEDVRVDEAVRADALARMEAALQQTHNALALEQLGRTLAAIGGQDVVAIFERVLRQGTPVQQIGAAPGPWPAGGADRKPGRRWALC